MTVQTLVLIFEKEVDGCKLMIDIKLFGLVLELYHQLPSPPTWRGVASSVIQNPSWRDT